MQIKITDVNVEISINCSRKLSNKELIKETLRGLIATAIEKICVLGLNGAQEELNLLRDVYIELVEFWDLGEDLLDEFDIKIGLVK